MHSVLHGDRFENVPLEFIIRSCVRPGFLNTPTRGVLSLQHYDILGGYVPREVVEVTNDMMKAQVAAGALDIPLHRLEEYVVFSMYQK